MLDFDRVPSFTAHFLYSCFCVQVLITQKRARVLMLPPTALERRSTLPTAWQTAMAHQRVTEGLRLKRVACWGQP